MGSLASVVETGPHLLQVVNLNLTFPAARFTAPGQKLNGNNQKCDGSVRGRFPEGGFYVDIYYHHI